MRKLVPGVLALAITAGVAWAADEAPAYDRRIDEAAAAIVAARMGELRGGLGLAERPVFVEPRRVAAPTPIEAVPPPEPADPWNDGLAIAVDPPGGRLPGL